MVVIATGYNELENQLSKKIADRKIENFSTVIIAFGMLEFYFNRLNL